MLSLIFIKKSALPWIISWISLGAAHAAVTPYAHYRMGDSAPTSNGGNNLPYDSSGNGWHMTNAGGGTSAITPTGGPSDDAYYTFNGSGWFGSVAGVAFAGSTGTANYTAGDWIHLAVVRSAGTSFRLQAWLNEAWSTFHTGTTCGRFSIHNLSDQSTNKIRVLIDSSTDAPSIWEIQAHQSDHEFTSWRDQQFYPNGNSHPAFAWDGDPDGDARITLLEFAFNGDPNKPEPSAKIAIRPSSAPGVDEFVFTAPARNGAIFTGTTPPTAAADGITYQVQGSLDLGSFNAPLLETFPAESNGMPPLDAGWSYHSFRHSTPGLQSGFFRVKTSAQ